MSGFEGGTNCNFASFSPYASPTMRILVRSGADRVLAVDGVRHGDSVAQLKALYGRCVGAVNSAPSFALLPGVVTIGRCSIAINTMWIP